MYRITGSSRRSVTLGRRRYAALGSTVLFLQHSLFMRSLLAGDFLEHDLQPFTHHAANNSRITPRDTLQPVLQPGLLRA